MDQIRELIDQLNYYTKLYDEGNPEIDDATWDKLYFLLQQLEEKHQIFYADSPTQSISYQVVNQLNKVQHNHPMLSLDKTKSEEDVVSFLGDHFGLAMAKMDGLTCSLRYINGKLDRAETRGNGVIGEDITHNIFFVKGVPLTIPLTNEIIVDGEVICTYDDFEEFKNDYKNPRNFASGSIRLLNSKESAQRKLTFVAWDCVKGIERHTLSSKLLELDHLGFFIVPFVPMPVNTADKVHHSIILIQDNAKSFSYPIDGVVFKYDDCAYYNSLGATEHHFRGGLAFKFYDEKIETNLRDIEWSMGKTGQLTPIAIFDDIEFDDAIVNRASLHNLNIMEQLLGKPYYGQKIQVFKANMIIPQVYSGVKSNDAVEYISTPEICPICGQPVVRKDDFLYCSNPFCDGKFVNQLVHFCGKKGLDIKGLSEATLQKLVDWGWVNNYMDLFHLADRRKEWILKPGFGEKSVDKLLETIEAAKTCELWQFISALGIPLIGSTYAKQMAKMEPAWFHIREDIEGGFDFTKWDGFGYEMNNSLHRFDYTEADTLAFEILNIQNNIWEDPMKVAPKPLADKKFVITGSLRQFKNRAELQKIIEDKGGKVLSSVSKNADYLINNDIDSTSAKNVAAKRLNVPIITEADFMELLD